MTFFQYSTPYVVGTVDHQGGRLCDENVSCLLCLTQSYPQFMSLTGLRPFEGKRGGTHYSLLAFLVTVPSYNIHLYLSVVQRTCFPVDVLRPSRCLLVSFPVLGSRHQ